MSGLAYYNEIDSYCAQWLRNLIDAGHIAPGIVDERSIEDVLPSDLAGFTQCHFFAGIGVWSYALRRAGWSDDRPVWTGSCPCQPFSSAGKGAGFDDERHLWPHFHYLISECRPSVVLGEQVASGDAGPWLDLVQDDLEGMDYAFGAVPFPSAGVGAPHIRDRLYWVADANHGHEYRNAGAVHRAQAADAGNGGDDHRSVGGGEAGGLAYLHGTGRISRSEGCETVGHRPSTESDCRSVRMANTTRSGRREECADDGRFDVGDRAQGIASGSVHGSSNHNPGPTNGLWADVDWLRCRDGKWRPVEPGTFPLAHGATSRVGRLRAYGNAINAEAARVFIEATMNPSSGLKAVSGAL